MKRDVQRGVRIRQGQEMPLEAMKLGGASYESLTHKEERTQCGQM